jgi:Rps23 Pro-64 3,4-dihydroxylase Tpa1-like proline 4-hydroxylase
MERLDKLVAQQAKYNAEVAHLREELELAKRRDEEALGEALAHGQAEPEPEAAAIGQEIDRNIQPLLLAGIPWM